MTLDDTHIVLSGEFGRNLYVGNHADKSKVDRDHHHTAFFMLLAGGGIRGGLTYGATDELVMKAVEKPVHVHDLHATLLHSLGLDHERLTYKYAGRDFRLTDVSGRVVREILARAGRRVQAWQEAILIRHTSKQYENTLRP